MKWSGIVEKIGSIGSILAAAACPACFPLLAIVGSALGLSVFSPFEGTVFLIFRILIVIALLGNVASWYGHRRTIPLITGVLSPLLILFVLYVYWNTVLLNLGLAGLLLSSILNYFANRSCKSCHTEDCDS